MKIGYVCTNYNNSDYTRGAVASLENSSYSDNYVIVVVDNCSTNEEREKLVELESDYPSIKVIYNSENMGYFRGLNLGLKYIKELDFDCGCVVIGNNDLVFPDDFYNQVISATPLLEKYAVISPDLLTLDGVHQNPHIRHGVSYFREFVWGLYYSNFYLSRLIIYVANKTKRISERKDYTSHDVGGVIYQGYGACYLLGEKFFDNFDDLWAPTFLMGEEFFLWKQVTDRGLEIYYEPSILVHHRDHATLEKVPRRNLWEMSKDAYRKYRELK